MTICIPSCILLALSALLSLLVHPVASQITGLNIPQGPANGAIPPAPQQAAAADQQAAAPAPEGGGEIIGNVNRMVFFKLRFGLQPGSDRLPLQGEVEELLCATQEFLLQHIGEYISSNQLNTEMPGDIRAVPTNIEYKHEAGGLDPTDTNGAPLTVEISFTIHATYVTQSEERVPEPVMIQGLEITDAEMLTYIYYVHDNTSGESMFQDVIRVRYDVADAYPHEEDRTIMLSEIPSCTDEQTIWNLPETIPPTVDPEGVDDMVYFKFGVNYPEDDPNIENAVPTQDEIHQLMCALNRFIQQELAEATGDDSITAQATNVQWIGSSTKQEAGITLYFTADATDGQGEPVPVETVSEALQNVNQDELLQFLKTEGVEHFLEEGDINPMLELPTSADLEPLPEGTPVREGNLEVSDCPSVGQGPPENSAPNRGSGFGLGNLVPGNGGDDDDGNGNGDDGDGTDNGDGNNGEDNGNGDDGSDGDGNGDDLGDASVMTIDVDFLVSNMDGITDPNQVKDQGIPSSWPTLVNEVVEGLKSSPSQPSLRGRRQRKLSSQNLGLVQYRTNSATVTKISPTTCGNNAPSELNCHTVHAKYDILLPKELLMDNTNSVVRYLQQEDSSVDISANPPPPSEDQPEIRRIYEVETYKSIYDGTYYDILLEDTPDSPMFIGTLPERAVNEPEDHYDWLWLVILLACLLALLLCCLLCCYLYHYCYRRREDEQEEEDRQVEPRAPPAVTHHTHVWVKQNELHDTTHTHTHHWDDEEASQTSQTSRGGLVAEEDDDPYAGALVPVETGTTQGQLIPLNSNNKSHHTSDPLRSQQQDSLRSVVSID